MNFQGVVMNVADLDRSIDFYREVLGFTLLSQKEQLAAVSAPGNDRAQVIVLRALGSSPIGGARHIGLRAFFWRSTLPINWSGSRVSWILGDFSSADVSTASGLPW